MFIKWLLSFLRFLGKRWKNCDWNWDSGGEVMFDRSCWCSYIYLIYNVIKVKYSEWFIYWIVIIEISNDIYISLWIVEIILIYVVMYILYIFNMLKLCYICIYV